MRTHPLYPGIEQAAPMLFKGLSSFFPQSTSEAAVYLAVGGLGKVAVGPASAIANDVWNTCNLLYKYKTLDVRKVATRITMADLPKDRILHESLKTIYRQQMEKPYVRNVPENERLIKIVNELYRPKAKIGSGSCADAVRYELATGNPVRGKMHQQKANDAVRFLEDWLDSHTRANAGDRAAVENILKDLRDSLGDKPWYSKTNAPK